MALRWGDIVRIHGVNLSKKKDTKGLIISKGYPRYYILIDLPIPISTTKSITNFQMLISIVSLCFKYCRGLILICMTSYLMRILRNLCD